MDPINSFLKELVPYDIPGSDRIRIGTKEADGGYVLLNKGLEDIDVLYSYGVGKNSDFEIMFCEKFNAIARLFDHTVDSPPFKKDFLVFKKEGLGPNKTKNLNTIENHINENDDQNKRLILKIDVDSAEWDTLLHIPNHVLGLFEQMAIEMHNLHSISYRTVENKGARPDESYFKFNGKNLSKPNIDKTTKVFRKINELFYLYHAHGVNYEPLYYTKGFKIPNVMELTFINKKHFKSAQYSKTIFPTKADRPSWNNRKEIDLHFWPFYPGLMQHISDIYSHSNEKAWNQIIDLICKSIGTKWKSLLIKMRLRRPTSYS